MPVIIDASIGGSASNSYVTLARGSDLIEQLPHMADWVIDYASPRAQFLVHATRLIDRHFWFSGSKASNTQALQWPRVGVTRTQTHDTLSSSTIPDFIEWATVEWAHAIYQDAEGDTDIAPGISRLRTHSYEVEFNGRGRRQIPAVVSDLLLPYGNRAPIGMIRLMRA